MRITFVNPVVNMSGGIRVVATYASLLEARGHNVSCIAPPARNPSMRERVSALRRGKLLKSRARPPSHFDRLFPQLKLLDTHRPVEESDVPDADVIVATWWTTAKWIQQFSHRKGVKVALIQGHETFPHIDIPALKATWRLPYQKIVVSNWLKNIALTEYQDDAAVVVPNGVDLELFNSPVRTGSPGPIFSVLYSPLSVKNSQLAFNAFKIARHHRPEMSLHVFSRHEPKEQLSDGVKVSINPSQPAIRDIYAGSAAYLFTSQEEGFGLPILEAMACRTPVIGTTAGAAPDFIASDNGWLLPTNDADAMAHAMIELADLSDDRWRAMSEAAYQRVASCSWENSVVLFEQALEKAIAKGC